MDAAAGEAAYADAQKSSDKQDLDPADFEDDGKDEFKGLDKKEKKKVKRTKREKEEAKHAVARAPRRQGRRRLKKTCVTPSPQLTVNDVNERHTPAVLR